MQVSVPGESRACRKAQDSAAPRAPHLGPRFRNAKPKDGAWACVQPATGWGWASSREHKPWARRGRLTCHNSSEAVGHAPTRRRVQHKNHAGAAIRVPVRSRRTSSPLCSVYGIVESGFLFLLFSRRDCRGTATSEKEANCHDQRPVEGLRSSHVHILKPVGEDKRVHHLEGD